MRRGLSKISSYIDFLHDSCGLVFEEPHEAIKMRENCRHLRNSFAHGDWEDVRSRIAQTRVNYAFGAVTLLLSSIESADIKNSGN